MTIGSLTKILILVALVLFAFVVYHQATFKFDYLGHKDKIWAHRVNSVQKLEFTQQKFAGVELDLVFDNKTMTFDVNHPPAPSIGLTLETYLNNFDTRSPVGIWLDFKNLNGENSRNALIRLDELSLNHQLDKSSIIIESQSPKYLSGFSDSGYKTSYYLPTFLNQLSSKELIERIKEIEQNMQSFPTTAISTNIVDYDIIAVHFPEVTKYLWSIDKTYTSRLFKNYVQTRKALQDPKVEVLLVRVNRKIGHR